MTIGDIRAYRQATPDLATSGQPSEAQLTDIAAAGYEVVINLALHDDPRYSLRDEAGSVRALGMDYVHIPVQFKAPAADDLARFFDAMSAAKGRRVWVHCAANLRVTAFLGLYRQLREGWPEERAFDLMRDVWQPDEVWSAFIAEQAKGPTPAMSGRVAIENYLRAKDHNRPWLMDRAFAEDALLEMAVNTGSIAFPPLTRGLGPITDVLVRRFAQAYENVHTFCLARPPADDAHSFSCDWLVGMSEKESKATRVGCGRYDWTFRDRPPHTVSRLAITIEAMVSTAPVHLASVMSWMSALPYPWCEASTALRVMPSIEDLQPVRRYLDMTQ